MFAGDLIMGRGSTILDVYADYMISLYKVRNLDPTILYPGHGETNIPAPLKIQESIKHRADRENQVLNAIEFPMNAEEIVNKVYGDLQGKIKAAALSNTSQYLEALKLKSLVELNESKWVRL